MSLYGIESEDDCRAKIDELLEFHARAERAMNKESIRIIKDRLAEYRKAGNTNDGKRRMSSVEERYFWPAINEAYVRAPNLNAPKTWRDGLSEIHLNLTYYRPATRTSATEGV